MRFKKDVAFAISLALPVLLLYITNPLSFEYAWKGRALYTLFLWLFMVELTMTWRRLPKQVVKAPGIGRLSGTVLPLPTLYVALSYVFHLEDRVIELGRLLGIPYGGRYGSWFLEYSWPLSIEYLIFTCLFLSETWVLYGKRIPKILPISSFFLAAVGSFYMFDTFYPFGASESLQWFVPSVARLATFFLNSMGYVAQVAPISDGWAILVTGDGMRMFAIAIYWPCAGIHSVILYSLTILLFISGTSVSPKRKLAYVVAGTAGTLIVNLLRIVSICVVGVSQGPEAAGTFHSSWGELYFTVWMFGYLTLILFVESLGKGRQKPKLSFRDVSLDSSPEEYGNSGQSD